MKGYRRAEDVPGIHPAMIWGLKYGAENGPWRVNYLSYQLEVTRDSSLPPPWFVATKKWKWLCTWYDDEKGRKHYEYGVLDTLKEAQDASVACARRRQEGSAT